MGLTQARVPGTLGHVAAGATRSAGPSAGHPHGHLLFGFPQSWAPRQPWQRPRLAGSLFLSLRPLPARGRAASWMAVPSKGKESTWPGGRHPAPPPAAPRGGRAPAPRSSLDWRPAFPSLGSGCPQALVSVPNGPFPLCHRSLPVLEFGPVPLTWETFHGLDGGPVGEASAIRPGLVQLL